MATATQKIRIELEIEVTPWSNERLAEEGGFSDEEVEFIAGDGLEEEVDPQAIAECIASIFYEGSEAVAEAFGGSAIYVDIGDATLIRAEQVAA